jgi:hypothetical protein
MQHISGSRPKAIDTLKIPRKDKKDLELHQLAILGHFFVG